MPAARLEVGQQGGTLADCIKIVDGEGNASLASHRQQVEHSVGRAARSSYTSNGIFKSLAGQYITGRYSTLQEIHDELATAPCYFILARIRCWKPCCAPRGAASKFQDHSPGI